MTPAAHPGAPSQTATDRRRWLSAGLWCTAGNAIGRGVPFVALLACARIIPQEDYGRVGIVHAAVQAFSVFGGLALNQVATHLAARAAADPDPEAWPRLRRRLWRVGLAALAAATLVMLATAAPIADRLIGDAALTLPLLLGAAWMAASVAQGTIVGELMGLGLFSRAALHNAIAGIAASVLMLAGGWLWSAPGIIGGIAAGYAVAILVHVLRAPRAAPTPPRVAAAASPGHDGVVRLLVMFSLGGALVWPTNLLMQLWLARQPEGLDEAAAFAIGNQMRMAIFMLTTSIGGGSLALLSAIPHREDPRRFLRVWLFGTAITLGICALACAPMILAPGLVMQLAGRHYAGHAEVLPWLGACCLVYTVMSSTNAALAAIGSGRAIVWAASAYAVLGVAPLVLVHAGSSTTIAQVQIVATLGSLAVALFFLRSSVLGGRS